MSADPALAVFDSFVAEAERLAAGAALGPGLTLERLVTAPEFAAFNASSAQRAFIRAADGVPLAGVLDDERLKFHFGSCEWPDAPLRPRIIIARTGVRAGKSLLAAMGLLKSALTCQLRRGNSYSRYKLYQRI